MTDITPIIEIVLALIGAVIAAFVVPYIRKKTSAAQWELIVSAVGTAVYAAEKLYKSGEGQKKKEYVIAWLAERNIKLDGAELDALVEAAVMSLDIEKGRGDAGI